MSELKSKLKCNKIHFVGVGGVSMSALAEYCKLNGFSVSGSETALSCRTDKLASLGCEIRKGHSSNNLCGAETVVYTSAVSSNNPEIKGAKRKKLSIFTRGEFLGEIIKEFKNSIAVSGCHGKTTATAMISSVLIKAGKDPTVFLGGDDYDYGNFRYGGTDNVVLEACEYQKSFLSIKPKIAVVLNVDNDHLDTYGNLDGIINAFNEFARDSIAIVNVDDNNCRKVYNATSLTFGIENNAHYYATNLRQINGKYSFTLNAYSKPYGRVRLNVQGKHNVYNALATFAVCDTLGISFNKIKIALERFNGIKRRNEYLGRLDGVDYYADYAHHPKELKAMINTLDESGEQYVTVFQPHTYSRTKNLMEDFVNVLKGQNPIVIYKTYPAREEFDKDGCAYELYKRIQKTQAETYYVEEQSELLERLNNLTKDVKRVVVFGAGDIYDIVKSFLK